MRPWSGTGWDQIYTFMWQKMTSMHQLLLQIISDLLRNEQCPMWQTLGRTVLIGKKNKILDRPEHFRPITCLSIIYKIQASLVNTVLRSHIFSNNIWPFEQLGTMEKTLGAKEAIIFDRVINREVRMYKRNLYVGWTDVRKGIRTITPRTITPGQIPPGQLPPRTNTPRTFTPPLRNFSSTYLGILCTYILHILFFLEEPNIHFMFHIINPFVYCK